MTAETVRAQPSRLIEFDISRQSADAALTAFAQQADVPVLFPYDQVSRVTANALVGAYDIQGGLRALLAGTGLSAEFGDAGQLVVRYQELEADRPDDGHGTATRRAETTERAASIAAPSDGTRQRASLEEIIVSARRVEENLQDVPISVAVLSAHDLELRGIETGEDLMNVAPNIVIAGGGVTQGDTEIVIRGMPNVGLYLDGVAQSSAGLLQQSLIELERVEVLRGPQGTLFGRNSNGGAIQMISRRPAPEFAARVTTELGSYDRQDLSVAVDLPLSSRLLSKFTLGQFKQEGHICSLIVEACYGGRDDELLRADFLWMPKENVELRIAYDQRRAISSDRKEALIVDPLHIRIAALNIAAQNPAFRNEWLPVSEYSPRTHNPGYPGGEVGEWETKSDGPEDGIQTSYDALTVTFNWDISEVLSLDSITAWWQMDGQRYADIRGAEVIEGVEDLRFLRDVVWSQEFHLTGAPSDRISWLAGLWYQNYDDRDVTYRWNVPWAVEPDGADPDCRPDPIPEIVDYVRDPANWGEYADLPVWGGDLATWVPQSIPSSACFGDPVRYATCDYAVFGELRVAIADALDLTLGARWSDRDRTLYRYSRQGVPGTAIKPDYPVTSVRGDVWAARELSADDQPDTSVWFTPKVSLDYHWSDTLMAYISYAEGFTAAEVSFSSTGGVYVETDPEIVKTTELGIHSDWLGESLRFNAAVFFTDWQNIRTEVAPVDPTGGIFLAPVIVTGGDAEAYGLDAEVVWRPDDDFLLNAALGLLDTKYVALAPGIPVDEDQPFAYAPKYSYNVGAQYDWRLANGGGLTLRGDYRYMDDYVTHERNDFQVPQEGFGLASARLIYADPSERWTAYLYGTNLTDERYWNSGFAGNGGVFFGSIGPRRELGGGFTFTLE